MGRYARSRSNQAIQFPYTVATMSALRLYDAVQLSYTCGAARYRQWYCMVCSPRSAAPQVASSAVHWRHAILWRCPDAHQAVFASHPLSDLCSVPQLHTRRAGGGHGQLFAADGAQQGGGGRSGGRGGRGGGRGVPNEHPAGPAGGGLAWGWRSRRTLFRDTTLASGAHTWLDQHGERAGASALCTTWLITHFRSTTSRLCV